MDRRLDWIVWKGLFAAALYFALIEQVGWVQYALSAFVWSMLVISIWSTPPGSAVRQSAPAAVSPLHVMVFDLRGLVATFRAQSYWTAFPTAATCRVLALIE